MNKISKGQNIISFQAVDILDKVQSPEKYIGEKWMLSFFRYASCPACNLRIHELLISYYNWNEKGFSIIAVFESPKQSILQYLNKHNIPFPIIPDPDLHLYEIYGVKTSWIGYILGAKTVLKGINKGFIPGKMEGKKNIIPADFLIDENGIIQAAYYGKHIGDHIPINVIESFIHQ